MIVKQIWQCLFLHLADGIHFSAIMSVRLPDTLYLLPDSPPESVPHPALQNNARARSPDNANAHNSCASLIFPSIFRDRICGSFSFAVHGFPKIIPPNFPFPTGNASSHCFAG